MTQQKNIYLAAEEVEKNLKLDFPKALEQAIENVKPGIELRKKRVGSVFQKIIIKSNPKRSSTVALQLLKDSVRENKERKPFFKILAEEFINAFNKTGLAFKKKKTF